MKINDNSPISKTSGTKKKNKTSPDDGNFSSLINDITNSGNQDITPSQTVGGINLVDSLFAVQQIENEFSDSQEAFDHGRQLLDFLDEIRNGLLDGNITRGKVQQLKSAVNNSRGWVIDKKLQQVLDEIEIRAEVELAKMESFSSKH